MVPTIQSCRSSRAASSRLASSKAAASWNCACTKAKVTASASRSISSTNIVASATSSARTWDSVALVSDPNDPDSDAPRVYYDLSEWDFEQQAELTSALADADIPHGWEG